MHHCKVEYIVYNIWLKGGIFVKILIYLKATVIELPILQRLNHIYWFGEIVPTVVDLYNQNELVFLSIAYFLSSIYFFSFLIFIF